MNLNVNADYTRSFNIGIYDDLLEYIYLSGKKEFDYRAFRHLFEQKKCIKHLICQIDNMIADIDFSYESSLADKCINYADILFKLAIKYGIKGSRDTLKSMGNIVHELRDTEYQLIERLIKLLQPYAEEEIYA